MRRRHRRDRRTARSTPQHDKSCTPLRVAPGAPAAAQGAFAAAVGAVSLAFATRLTRRVDPAARID